MKLLFALPLLAFVPCACAPPFGVFGRHEIVLALPAAPAAWSCLSDLRMEVHWKSPDGKLRSASAPPGARLHVEVGRGIPQGILAYPFSGARPLKPAGALYPEALTIGSGGMDDGADLLVLDWQGGYAASIAAELLRGGLDPWAYDLSRLAAEASGRCSDPWLIPCLEAARRLTSLEFRIDAYQKPSRAAMDLPGPGPWAPESPYESAPEASGGASVAMLSEGLWRFVAPAEELFVSVGGDGTHRFVRR